MMPKSSQNKQLQTSIEPIVTFNKLFLKNVESAFNLQIASIQALTQLGLQNFNAGLEIRSADDLKVYAESQKEVAEEVTAQITSDVKAFGELGAKFVEETRGLTETNLKVAKAA